MRCHREIDGVNGDVVWEQRLHLMEMSFCKTAAAGLFNGSFEIGVGGVTVAATQHIVHGVHRDEDLFQSLKFGGEELVKEGIGCCCR